MLYVTERCVFRLTADGLELIEIAPGIDLEKDVLAHVGFTPIIDGEPKLMDERPLPRRPHGPQRRSALRSVGRALHLRRRPQHLFSSIWRVCRCTPRQTPRPSSPRSRRGWPRSARRFPSWSTMTTSTWRRTSPTHTPPAVRGLRRTLLRQRHPLHHKLIYAPQALRPSH